MKRQSIQIGCGLLAMIAVCVAIAANPALFQLSAGAESEKHPDNDVPLTPQQIRALIDRVIANQRSNDRMLEEYARTEHAVVHRNGKGGMAIDTTSRVVPVGAGIAHVELDRNGQPADSSDVEQQWRGVAQALLQQSQAGEPRSRQAQDRGSKRKRERLEMIDAFGQAFLFHWAGRTTSGGRTLIQLTFDPNPAFRSSARFANLYAHTSGVVWIDESTSQLARAAAELTDDVTWAAGLIAKLYKGGQFTYEQQELSPGLWAPAVYSYDFDGRKFLFGTLSEHERVDYRDYRRIGPPEEALGLIRREHPALANDAGPCCRNR
jgi:hypothetical protein